MGVERGPLSLVSTTEKEEKKIAAPGLENPDYSRRGSAALTTRHPLYPQDLALTSPTRVGSSVGIVRLLTEAT
jgi:hypothetical protein